MKLKRLFTSTIAGALLILPTWADDALAQKVGFAAHAPKDTNGYLSVIGAGDIFDRIMKSEVGKFLIEAAAEQGDDFDEIEKTDEFQLAKAVWGEELFAVFGDSAGEQGANLMTLNTRSNFEQMKMLVKMAAVALKGGDEIEPDRFEDVFGSYLQALISDPEAGLGLVEKAVMPPITIGFKVSNEETRTQLSQTIIGGLTSLFDLDEEAPFAELDQEISGVQLTGVTIVGEKLVASIEEENRQQMAEPFGSRANVDRALAALAKKDLHLASGVKGEYILIFVGGSLDGFKVIADPADSLAAAPGMEFMKDYADKDVRLLVYSDGESSTKIAGASDTLASIANGVKAGLAEEDIFGDTRDIQALLGHIAKVEGQIYEMFTYSDTGVVGFIEDGFKIESHGGTNLPSIDSETPHNFAKLGNLENLLLFSNSRSNPEFTSKLQDLADSFGEATYLMAGRIAALDVDSFDLDEFREGFAMFEKLAAGDLSELWKAFSGDWAAGTGDEGAWVIDTKGTLPKVPGIPSVIVEKGRMPRIAYVTPVADREKLSSAWGRMEKSITNILKTVEEQGGYSIPMQEIEGNTQDGLTFFKTAIQFSTKDARPVVGISDKNFYLSTSENFITEMEAALAAEGNAAEQKGSLTQINLLAAYELADYWLTLLAENADAVFENEYQRDDFNTNLPQFKSLVKALQDLKGISSHTRLEDGKARTSLHIETR